MTEKEIRPAQKKEREELIGSNVVIGGRSAVTKDIPDNAVAVGNPCKVLRPVT